MEGFIEGPTLLDRVGRGRGRDRGLWRSSGRLQRGEVGGDGLGLGHGLGPMEEGGHGRARLEGGRVGDPAGHPLGLSPGADPGEGRGIGGKLGHRATARMATMAAQLREEIPATAQEGRLPDLRRGPVAEGGERDRIEGHVLGRPIHPDLGVPLGRGGVFGHDDIGSLVEADLRAFDPRGAETLGIEDRRVIDPQLEAAVEGGVEQVVATQVDGDLARPDGGEGADGNEGCHGLTRRYEQGDALGQPVIGEAAGAHGECQPG